MISVLGYISWTHFWSRFWLKYVFVRLLESNVLGLESNTISIVVAFLINSWNRFGNRMRYFDWGKCHIWYWLDLTDDCCWSWLNTLGIKCLEIECLDWRVETDSMINSWNWYASRWKPNECNGNRRLIVE